MTEKRQIFRLSGGGFPTQYHAIPSKLILRLAVSASLPDCVLSAFCGWAAVYMSALCTAEALPPTFAADYYPLQQLLYHPRTIVFSEWWKSHRLK